jgi:hypothetical protein
MKPWPIVAGSFAAICARAWGIRHGAPDAALSPLTTYFSDALGLWARGSAVLLACGAALSFFPAERRSDRAGWAWASWSVFFAAVPPRPGGDELLVYLAVAMVALSAAWVCATLRIGARQLFAGVAAVSTCALTLFSLQLGQALAQKRVECALAASLAIAGLLTAAIAAHWRGAKRGAAAAGPDGVPQGRSSASSAPAGPEDPGQRADREPLRRARSAGARAPQ